MKPRHLLLAIGAVLGCVIALAQERAGANPPYVDRLEQYAGRAGHTLGETFAAAAEVDPKKGVGEYEAYILSKAYLWAFINECGGISALRDEGERWVAETRVGEPPPDPGPLIFVDKTTGATSSRDERTVTDPKIYLQLIPH